MAVKVAIKIIFSTKYFHAYLAANKFRPTRRNFGQKRAKCVKLEKCAATPGSAHLEQAIYASQVSAHMCFDKKRKANEPKLFMKDIFSF